MLDISVEKLDDINYVVSGTVQNATIKEKVEQLKQDVMKQAEVKDLDEEQLEKRAAGYVFQEFIDAGVKDAEIAQDSLVGQPALKKYEKTDDAIYFEVDIAVMPELDVNIDYKDVVPSYTKPEPSAEAKQAKLDEFLNKQGTFAAIETPRAVQNGDMTVIDFKGMIDGVPFEGGTAEKYSLVIGSNSFIPGFEEQLIGMEYGEERTITVNFPENYQSEDLAGKESQFEIKLHEIKLQQPAVANDELAKQALNDQSATLDTLIEKLSEQVAIEQLSALYDNELKPKLVKALLEKFDFTLPNNLVSQELDMIVRDQMQYFKPEERQKYQEQPEKFKDFKNSFLDQAKESVKIAVITQALAKKEDLTVDEQEATAALTYQAMMAGQDAQALVGYYRQNNLMPTIIQGLTEDKLFGQMLGFDR